MPSQINLSAALVARERRPEHLTELGNSPMLAPRSREVHVGELAKGFKIAGLPATPHIVEFLSGAVAGAIKLWGEGDV